MTKRKKKTYGKFCPTLPVKCECIDGKCIYENKKEYEKFISAKKS